MILPGLLHMEHLRPQLGEDGDLLLPIQALGVELRIQRNLQPGDQSRMLAQRDGAIQWIKKTHRSALPSHQWQPRLKVQLWLIIFTTAMHSSNLILSLPTWEMPIQQHRKIPLCPCKSILAFGVVGASSNRDPHFLTLYHQHVPPHQQGSRNWK
jgi:hypothetical protein